VSDRFVPLTRELLDADAASVYDEILATRKKVADIIRLVRPDGSLRGPFDPLLRSPQIANVVQLLGTTVRAQSTLPAAVCEVVILTVVRLLACDFEWEAHARLAVHSGLLDPQDVEDIAAGRSPGGASDRRIGIAWSVSRQQVESGAVNEAALEAALAAFGERGLVELTVLVGYYGLVALLMRACAPATPVP
jgi:4-carboxymuconolactone decarboxylase